MKIENRGLTGTHIYVRKLPTKIISIRRGAKNSLKELFIKVRGETLRQVLVERLVKLLVQMAASVQPPDVAHSGRLSRELLLLLE